MSLFTFLYNYFIHVLVDELFIDGIFSEIYDLLDIFLRYLLKSIFYVLNNYLILFTKKVLFRTILIEIFIISVTLILKWFDQSLWYDSAFENSTPIYSML